MRREDRNCILFYSKSLLLIPLKSWKGRGIWPRESYVRRICPLKTLEFLRTLLDILSLRNPYILFYQAFARVLGAPRQISAVQKPLSSSALVEIQKWKLFGFNLHKLEFRSNRSRSLPLVSPESRYIATRVAYFRECI